ncbi:MAG: L,D-transpeptidase family protein [Longibaculum sp.]
MKKGGLGIGICVLLVGCTTTQEKPKQEVQLQFNQKDFVEYGGKIDTKDFVKNTNGKILHYPTLDTSQVGKKQLEYVVNLDDEEKTYTYEIEVKDTQKPVIQLKKEKVELEYNGKLDIPSYIESVKDPVDGKISYKKDVKENDKHYYTYTHNVNVKKAGNYTISIKAVDKNNNETIKKVKVIVKDKKEEKPQQVTSKPSQTEEKKETIIKPEETQSSKPIVQVPQQKDYSYVLESTVEKMKAAQGCHNLVTVTAKEKSRKAVVQYFEKENGKWVEKMKTNGQVGKAGIGTGSENSTRTPAGSYHFTHAYGIKANPGSLLPYSQITENHYWCGGQYYNQFVDETSMDHSQCPSREHGDEHLIDYPIAYSYFLVFNYNSSNTPGKGFAYFLHSQQGSYTQGCVSIPESQMVYLLKKADSSTGFVVSLIDNIENY